MKTLSLASFWLLLGVSMLLKACDTTAPLDQSVDGINRSEVLRPDLVRLISNPSIQASSPAFDPTESYAAAVMTITQSGTSTFTEPFIHPNTGVPSYQHTYALPSVEYFVEAGYGLDGDFLYNQVRLYADSSDPLSHFVDETVSVHVANGQVTVIDQDGEIRQGESLTLADLGIGHIVGFSNLFVYPDHTGSGPNSPPMGPSVQAQRDDRTPGRGHLREQTERHERIGNDRARVVIEGLLDRGPQAEGQAPVTARMRVTRNYRRQKGQMLIEGILTEIEQPGQMSARTDVRFSQVRVRVNEIKEGQRRSRGGTPIGAPVGRVVQLGAGGENCNPDYTIDPAACEPVGQQVDLCPNIATGENVMFVHGFNSNAATWGSRFSHNHGVRGRLRCMVLMASDDAPTLPNNGLASHAVQSNALRSYIESKQRNNYILVAHSQGGLISRHVAHQFINDADEARIKAIVSIGSPHRGAAIASNMTLAKTTLLGLAICPRWMPRCGPLNQVVATAASGLLSYHAMTSPAVLDLSSRSTSIRNLNSQPEFFRRVSISHAVPKWLIAYRFAGDMAFIDGGRTAVRAGNLYLGAYTMGMLVGHFTGNPRMFSDFALLAAEVLRLNVVWDLITSQFAPSDGFITRASQTWPWISGSMGGGQSYRTLEARKENRVSHMGQTKTLGSTREIRDAFRDVLSVEERRIL